MILQHIPLKPDPGVFSVVNDFEQFSVCRHTSESVLGAAHLEGVLSAFENLFNQLADGLRVDRSHMLRWNLQIGSVCVVILQNPYLERRISKASFPPSRISSTSSRTGFESIDPICSGAIFAWPSFPSPEAANPRISSASPKRQRCAKSGRAICSRDRSLSRAAERFPPTSRKSCSSGSRLQIG